MNRRQEREIIRTLVAAGHEPLAKQFAINRGYRIQTSKSSNETCGNPVVGKDWWSAGNDWVQKLATDEYKAQLARHMKKRAKSTFRYTIPEWQQEAIRLLGENDEEGFKALKLGLLQRGFRA